MLLYWFIITPSCPRRLSLSFSYLRFFIPVSVAWRQEENLSTKTKSVLPLGSTESATSAEEHQLPCTCKASAVFAIAFFHVKNGTEKICRSNCMLKIWIMNIKDWAWAFLSPAFSYWSNFICSSFKVSLLRDGSWGLFWHKQCVSLQRYWEVPSSVDASENIKNSRIPLRNSNHASQIDLVFLWQSLTVGSGCGCNDSIMKSKNEYSLTKMTSAGNVLTSFSWFLNALSVTVLPVER